MSFLRKIKNDILYHQERIEMNLIIRKSSCIVLAEQVEEMREKSCKILIIFRHVLLCSFCFFYLDTTIIYAF